MDEEIGQRVQSARLAYFTERQGTFYTRRAASRELRAVIEWCQLDAAVSDLVNVESGMSILGLS